MKFLNGITDKYIGSFNGFYVNKLKNIELAIKVLLVIVIAQLLINILMVNYVVQASIYKEVNISVSKETLNENTNYKYEKNTASRTAFENTAYSVLYQITSFDYTTIENRTNWLLSMVHPDHYETIYNELKEDARFAVANRVNQKFEIKDWKYKQLNSSTAKITAEGFLSRTVGGVDTIRHVPYEASVVVHISNYSPFVMAVELNYDGKKRFEREKREETINNYDRPQAKGIKDEKQKK
jgi:hypothetical protein